MIHELIQIVPGGRSFQIRMDLLQFGKVPDRQIPGGGKPLHIALIPFFQKSDQFTPGRHVAVTGEKARRNLRIFPFISGEVTDDHGIARVPFQSAEIPVNRLAYIGGKWIKHIGDKTGDPLKRQLRAVRELQFPIQFRRIAESPLTVEPPLPEPIDDIAFPCRQTERRSGLSNVIRDVKRDNVRIHPGFVKGSFPRRKLQVQIFTALDIGIIITRSNCADRQLKKRIPVRRDENIVPIVFAEFEKTAGIPVNLAVQFSAECIRCQRCERAVVCAIRDEIGFEFFVPTYLPGPFHLHRLAETIADGPFSRARHLRLGSLKVNFQIVTLSFFRNRPKDVKLKDRPVPLAVVLKFTIGFPRPCDNHITDIFFRKFES
ncbi:hypothetical protein [uncultured Victivallis sp.]|uniref:hypothetical protein n=1 Tax=uncultured Victivallis sp. TaxID=354118 RepID=UPI0025F7F236|nr:hypothetical protein [uncultured Victivallis sp.]